ncbi:long-chain fatty acid--CoA ligase [Mycolicibacterium fluoranthenivorans]|jgi:long-chain acyl-CoA synthetase|uniref:Long-chain fatty acid--CoA ligase n=1 Tax=Mycolicibacterium fluoranthenivorans TaxID=258505 RepID=A0A7G8PHY4_9MYCO|nr:AMP-dependent synthetase/ligase [Mycolicibacterium fluoranthenivorans]QNJ93950.1 long-chain fatty acid--CoA ligase [Mycolicibacterium fluoranthenivorans]
MKTYDRKPAAVSSAVTVADLFFERVAATPDAEAFRFPVGVQWHSMTWAESYRRVTELAAGLLALGLAPEERVAIASGTRLEWVLADLAIMCAGAATTTVYPSAHAEDTAHILRDSACRVAFAEDGAQVAKLRAHRDSLSALKAVVVFDGDGDGDWVMTLDDLAQRGANHLAQNPDCVHAAVRVTTENQLATLIYTSGTTGQPKGVRLTHHAWVSQARAAQQNEFLGVDDVQLLWLPLAHSLGKVVLASQLACGFVSAIDARVDKIVDNMAAVKPTFVAMVPRIIEKIYSSILARSRAEGSDHAELVNHAFALGIEMDRHTRAGREVSVAMVRQREEFDQLVFSPIRELLGGRLRFFTCGSAPLNRDIAEWFHAAGLLILEGYGLTETAGTVSLGHPDRFKLGTVGPPLDGVSVRISDEGEVQVAGSLLMAGYHHLPEETAQVMADDGWLSTGDKGSLDEDGFLSITGRIKELFKTSGGKYIAPLAIEAKFLSQCPYVSQFIVFGEARQFCVALIALDAVATRSWAAEQGLSCTSLVDLVRTPQLRAMIDEHITTLNAGLNRWETIKGWELLDHELSIQTGELTPSLKVKRSVIAERNKDVLDAFYT